MSRNSVIILTLIFFILGGYVYLFEFGPREENGTSDEIIKLLDFVHQDISEIKVKAGDNLMLFKKHNDQWKITSPVKANVDNLKIDSMLAAFNFGIIGKITNPQPDLAEYGLDNPLIEFGLKSKGDEKFKILHLGGNTPSELSCYARLQGQPEVFVVGILYKHELGRDLGFFVD